MDLQRPQRRRGVGGEERVAGAGGEDHHAALLEVAHGAAADVGLGDLLDVDRREHPGVLAGLLQRVLQGQRVEHRRQHAHVVAGRPVHPLGRGGEAAVDVAGADDDRDLDPAGTDRRDLLGDALHLSRIGAVAKVAHQRLARELEQDAFELGVVGHLGPRAYSSPTRK